MEEQPRQKAACSQTCKAGSQDLAYEGVWQAVFIGTELMILMENLIMYYFIREKVSLLVGQNN